MSTNTKRLLIAIAIMVAAAIGLSEKTHALRAPHDSSKGISLCSECHSRTGAGFRTITSFNNLCFNDAVGCHNSSGGPYTRPATKKRLSMLDASNRFGSIAQSPAAANTIMPRNVATQSSHGWKIPNSNPSAGVPAGNQGLVGGGLKEDFRTAGKIYCNRCHRAMGVGAGTVYGKFLRADPTGNYVCMQCHTARRTDNVRGPLQTGLDYSHPVEVNYSTAHGKKPDFFYDTPQLASVFGYKTSASVKLYTTHETAQVASAGGSGSRLGGKNKGAVVCQTCHGPIHSADSNPYTFDNLSAWSRGVANYSSSAGNLLRQYPIAGPKASDNLCLSCHKVKVHETNYPGLPANYFSCGRCHTPHKKAGEANRYLILENISTPFNGIRPVYFVSTSAMAKRYGAGPTESSSTNKSLLGGYSTALSRLNMNRTVSAAICQVCHTRTKYQRNYSSPNHTRRGGAGTGHDLVYNDATGKYRFCPDCHMHTSSFKPSGAAACSSCHVAPPYDTYSGGASTRVIGRHAKHVKYKNGDSTNASYSWDGGTLVDDRSQDAYGFSCGRCHSPYANYSDSQHKPSSFDDGVFSIRTADVGFVLAANAALPKNPGATYTYENRGVGDWGANNLGSKWSTPDVGGYGRCNNLYCHGQWYNGYTSNNPKFTGTQPCGSCHGAKPNDPPGKTGGASNNYGAHPRHVGNANNQQYGSGAANFRCNACHNKTVNTSITSIDDRSIHVNGRVEIAFNQSGNYPGDANSNYNGLTYSNATSRKPDMSRPAYRTCGLIYCHSDGSRTQGNYSVPFNAGQGSGTTKFPNWSSSSSGNFTTTQNIGGKTFKRRCSRCHGNSSYAGITAAMPGYTSMRSGPTGKGNSHKKHVIVNGFMCNVCHSETVNADNKSIASTTKHVNKTWDIKILRSYSGIYDPNTHTCSMVSCHGRQTTPVWGNTAVCQNCHLNNTGDYDKRILNKTFQSFSELAPKIYSGAGGNGWGDRGHGRPSGSYYGKDSLGNDNGNPAANRSCAEPLGCHRSSVKHGTAKNPFRLFTTAADGNPNTLCQTCHSLSPTNPNPATTQKTKDIQTHASSVTQTGRYNFAIKCVDCHDPHGDNNILMLHSTIGRPKGTSPANRREASDSYGRRLTNVTGYNVDFVDNQYTSNYARKYNAPRICQVCHTQTKNPTDSSKGGRFRWYSTGDKGHGSNKCTNCHSHSKGFKGAGCDGCHGFPPTGLFNLLSGEGRINATKKRSSSSATAGAHGRHTTIFGGSASTCSKCHWSGMWGSGSESGNIDIEFRPFADTNPLTNYTGASQKYYGQIAVKDGYYGYSGVPGIKSGANDSLRCAVKCHGGNGWLTNSLGNYTAPKWDDKNTVKCGKCHGAKRAPGIGSWPTSNRHQKHAGTDTGNGQYNFMCRLCHGITVLNTATTLSKSNHVTGTVQVKFTSDINSRVDGSSSYGGDTVVNSGFGACQNLYCHSRGTSNQKPYTSKAAYPNYTAKWDLDISGWPEGKKCSFCHGNKVYEGITSAMPNQSNQAHKKHVVDNGLKCYFCHSATVNSGNGIASVTNHVNRFKNISIVSAYRQGATNYSATVSTKKTCKNVRCHAGRTTPNWTVPYGTINCPDCHYSNTSDTDNFTFNNFSGTAARIYSTEWAKRGHGKPANSAYAFSNNSGAGKTCTNCHKPTVKHGAQDNYFRLLTSNPDRLCLSCHGRSTDSPPLGTWGISNITGIQSHTWNNISTAGYKGGKIKAASRGGWNFGEHDSTDKKKVKCVDCHDPHGDKNNYMIHTYPNFSGSDRVGRPSYTITGGMQMTFSTVGGPQMNWSSYVKPIGGDLGICQRCHSEMFSGTTAIMDNFNKNKYSNHNRTNRCTKCHKHREGFKPSGCDGCHSYPPPNGPTTPNNWLEQEGSPTQIGLHTPHAKNPRNRPGITAENDVAGAAGFMCKRCHANTNDGSDPSMGAAGNTNAIMTQLTSVYGDWSPGAQLGKDSVTDDTCRSIKCHTPRYYERTWKKPSGCDSCHGYRNKANGEAFNIQTSGSHKIHVNYSTPGIAGTDLKKYGLRCSNCHYDWQALNNYSTHYSSYVNITANGPVNTIANMKIKDGQFYTRGREFKGFTTGNESLGTCAKAYCHGNFQNGTTATMPNWKKGVSPVTCTSCHKGRLTFGNASTMPERHQRHVKTNQYGFACTRCHTRTTNNITTIIFNYSSHVNGRKDVYFNNDLNNGSGSFASASRQCANTYCHSKGYRSTGSFFATRTTLANYTADWDYASAEARTGAGKGCSFCHGNKTYAGITAAMPNQTSLWGNSHRTHVIRNNFRCIVCHSATVNAAGQIATYGSHVNGFKNVTIIAAYKTGQTLYSSQVPAANKTCKNVRCHAGKKTPKWGTYIRCQDCHLSNTGDTDKRISANNSFQSFTGKTVVAPRIYSTAWTKTGHGRQSAYSSGNPAANRVCTSCHKASVPHGTTGNRFRLYTINSATGNPNTLCEDCHGTAPGNPVATKTGIQTHASSVTQTGRHNFSIKCIDCHDPHGDNNTRFMVHSTVARPRITGTRAEISNAYGSIFLNATGRNVDFTQNQYSSDYAKKVTSPKICQVCHTRTFKPGSSAVTRFRAYSSEDMTHGTGKCTNCHSHTQGFKGMACNACHGFPPTSANTLIGRPGTNQVKTMSGSTTAGAHQRHVDVFGLGNDTCNKCHSGGMAFNSNENDDITLKFEAFGVYTGINQKYEGQSAVRTGFYGYSGDGIAVPGNNNLRCSSVKCHGAQGSWLTASYGPVTAPKWDDKNTAKCGKCHGAKKAPGSGSWPTTKAHALHAGTDNTKQLNLMCRNCHGITVLNTATTLSKANHVNAQVFVELTSAGEARIGGDSAYSGDTAVNKGFGSCTNVYCHSTGTDRVAPYGEAPNFSATWTTIRGTYKKAQGQLAKCNFCHGNQSWSGVTSAMPNYLNDSPKANKHPKHVFEYNFLCANCHVNIVANNTSIRGDNYTNHVNRVYNVDFGTGLANSRNIDNNMGRYTSTNSGCRGTYCHSRGTKLGSAPYTNTTALANYTAHWGDSRGGYKKGSGTESNMTRCNYCHGNRQYNGMTSAMPNYTPGSPKANRHPMHVVNYGFTCTVCHEYVTSNNTSIDASGGTGRHVNQNYNIDFNRNARSGFTDNTGTYTYVVSTGGGAGSKCKNTYCHSRGTDNVTPFNTRTSFANWTARWGDDRGGYKTGAGSKAKCNYCHGNRLFSGITSAMPNYSTSTAKNNTHPIHVRSYGFTCNVCHVKVVANNTAISDRSLHVNKAYNINFKADVRGNLTNNTGVYSYTDLTTKNRCKNVYCHSRGTDLTKPFNTRTSLANFTAMWGDSRNGYKQAKGVKAKCNYCHGNRAYSGMTSAMPNYSGTTGAGYGVTAKANSHRVHVVGNGFVCSTCHYGVVPNNTSISDRTSHVNGFYNISITPSRKAQAGKAYSTNWTNRTAGGTCMRNTCHGGSNPKWGDPSTANCKMCHFSYRDKDDYARPNNSIKTEIYSTEWKKKGHGQFTPFTSTNTVRCTRCHNSDVGHNAASNPFRLWTSEPGALCLGCHGSATERLASWGANINATNTDYKSHTKANAGVDAAWNTHTSAQGKGVKCVDCHDPHGDKNRKMIHSYLNHSGSDKYGRPAGPGWGAVNYTTNAMMTFTTWGDAQPIWSSFANNNLSRSICRRCHSTGDSGMGNAPSSPAPGNMTKGNYAADHQAHTDKCTTNCHTHKSGFKGGGESQGGSQCKGCHAPLFNAMTTDTSFHHVLSNTSTAYRNVTLFTGGAARNPNRRCLMCHVDHDVFRPDKNTDGTGGRARNLRFSAGRLNDRTGINTDFWPAKRAGKYAATNPVMGPTGYFGVCASCHKNAQSKNTTFQLNNQGEKATPVFGATNFIATYTSSSHNFQIITGMSRFMDGSKFRANCSKCHGSPDYAIQNPQGKGQAGANARQWFGLHDSNYQSLNRPLGNITAMPNPLSKQLCFRCHSQIVRGSYDFYSSVQMNTGAKLIQTAIEAKPTSNHPVGQYGGHVPDEYSRANTGWNNYIKADGSEVKHIECTDCHNTHGGNASIVRSVGSPNANRIGGAQAGVWGVTTSGNFPAAGGQPTYKKEPTVTYQWQVCAKCHTKFGWGANHPIKAPSQGYNTFPNYSVYFTDVVKEFNPKNYGYHPVAKAGRNQPDKAANGYWPAAASGIRWYDAYNNISGQANISGLDWAFNPPFNRRSTIGCSDCHQADSTMQAVASFLPNTVVNAGDWSDATKPNLVDAEGMMASHTPSTTTAMEISVNGTLPSDPSVVNVAVWTKHNKTNGSLNLHYVVKKVSSGATTISGDISVEKALTSPKKYLGADIKTLLEGVDYCNGVGNVTQACLNDLRVLLSETVADTNIFYVDKTTIEATFTMTDALRGPHGSMMQWILASANTQLNVDWNNDKDAYLDPGEVVNPTASIDVDYEKRTFCWNCHRFRTYQLDTTSNGDYSAAEALYSRFKHYRVETDAGTSGFLGRVANNKWGIPCMFCHGGAKAGAIHGDWETQWIDSGAGAVTLQRPVGVRLLNGAGAHYATLTGGTGGAASVGDLVCYVDGGSPLASCGGDGTPVEGTVDSTIFNYSYTAY